MLNKSKMNETNVEQLKSTSRVEQQPYKYTTMANASSLERKLANNAEHIETIYNQTP